MAEWIWYPGDREIKTLNEVSARRYMRDVIQPPVWQSHAVEPSVKFGREFTLSQDDELVIRASGEFNIELDGAGKFVHGFDGVLPLKAGKHSLCIHVFASGGKLPCVYVKGREIQSDKEWQCTLLDGKFVYVGTGGFTDENMSPDNYALPLLRREAVKTELKDDCVLYDFGEETFGYIEAEEHNGKGEVKLYFGESREEAEDFECCEKIGNIALCDGRTRNERTNAFRFVAAVCERGAKIGKLVELYEYRPQPRAAKFECENKELQRIWETAMHTFMLNTREFFLDGIKRDRWVWSGDASQSYLLNAYSFFDEETARNTIVALGGKNNVVRHMNTIVDYSLYWLISCRTHYRYTGDTEFLKRIYPRFTAWADFVLSRTDSRGFLIAAPEDWVFIDWNDAITKDGDVYSFLQILLYGALCAGREIASVIGETGDAKKYASLAKKLCADIQDAFWCEDRGGYAHSLKDGKSDLLILRQNNVMAVLCGIADERKSRKILTSVLFSDAVPAITTPYMRFYEFTALCLLGETERVYIEMMRYFGGMLKLGATSFWEYFDPEQKGAEHYGMYDRKYGKSLCHAWGATPLWIIGRFLLGVKPLECGYGKIAIEPRLDLLGNCNAEFPLKKGTLKLGVKDDVIHVTSSLPGELTLYGEHILLEPGATVSRERKKDKENKR